MPGGSDKTARAKAHRDVLQDAVTGVTSSVSRAFAKVAPNYQQELDLRLKEIADNEPDTEATWKKMARLVKGGARLDREWEYENPLLIRVCGDGKSFIAGKMLDAGLDPDTRGKDGATPFLAAANAGQPDTMSLLADRGATLDARRNDGKNAMDLLLLGANPRDKSARVRYCIAYKMLADRAGLKMPPDTRRWIFSSKQEMAFIDPVLADEIELVNAAGQGNLKTVKKLLASGIPPDSAKKYNENRALYGAIEGGHAGVVEALCEGGANVRRNFERRDMKPIRLAAMSGSKEVFQTLVDWGADPTAPIIFRHQMGGQSVSTLDKIAEDNQHPELAEFIRKVAGEWTDRNMDVSMKRDVSVGAPLKLCQPPPAPTVKPLRLKLLPRRF